MGAEVSPRRGLGLKRLGSNASMTFVANFAAAGIGFALSILLTRGLGTQGLGTYALALLLPNTMVLLLEFGITYANVYYIGRGDVNAREVMRANLWIWGFVTVVGLAAAGAIVYFKGAQWFPGIPTAMMIVAIFSFPPNLLQFYCRSILQGYQDFRRYNYLTVIVSLTTLVLSAVLILGFHLGVGAALGAFLLGQLLSLLFTVIALAPYLRKTPKEEAREHWWTYGRHAVSYGWKQHLGAVVAFVNYRVDLFFVNLMLGPATAGVYYIAIQLGESMWMISKVVSTVLLPRLAELHGEEQTRLELTPLITRLVFCFTAAVALVVALLSPLIVSLWGPEATHGGERTRLAASGNSDGGCDSHRCLRLLGSWQADLQLVPLDRRHGHQRHREPDPHTATRHDRWCDFYHDRLHLELHRDGCPLPSLQRPARHGSCSSCSVRTSHSSGMQECSP